MNKNFTCIECPSGCIMCVDIVNGKVIAVSGNNCSRGEKYARSEVENPERILTSTVVAEGLDSRMVSVRTRTAIPKDKIVSTMKIIHKLKLNTAIKCGEIVVENINDTGVDLLATRDAEVV